MTISEAVTKPVSKEVAIVAVLEKQQELLRELHHLLTLYAPAWYTEEMDARLATSTAKFTVP